MLLNEAITFVQKALVKSQSDKMPIFDAAVAGAPGAKEKAISEISRILADNLVLVENLPAEAAAAEIYKYAWGLGILEDLYRDAAVDEIRINGPEHIFISRKGKNQRVDLKFDDPGEAQRIIDRLYQHDVGIALTETTPRVESVREDGTRLTALCRPVADTHIATLRRPNTFKMTAENLCNNGTLDQAVWDILCFLVRGRANLLIVGGFGSGKSSLQRRLIKELPESLRIISLGADRELRLKSMYPDRDIIELEEHENFGMSLKDLLRTVFRLSPDVIIFEEFRGAGEAIEAIKACRVLKGSTSTAHFISAEEAVEGTAMMMLEEGLALPFELAKIRVARAFNIVVEMFSDTERGIKKLVKITEIGVENNTVFYLPLVMWEPDTDDYLGPGRWVLLNPPSDSLVKQMARYIDAQKEVVRIWSGCIQ